MKDDIDNFSPDNVDSYPHETIGCWKLRDRKSAERTLEWIKKRVRKGFRGRFPIIDTRITERPDGRFDIDVFKMWQDGEPHRVC